MISNESKEQIKLFQWINLNHEIKHCSFHIPNESKRSIQYGALLKKMGMRAGASDIFIAKPNKKYHGMFIELKAAKKSGKFNKPTELQLKFIDDMRLEGYFSDVANGADDAINMIKEYLKY